MSLTVLSGKRRRKAEVIEEVQKLLSEYPTVVVARLQKVKARYLQELRMRFRGRLLFKVVKNRLFKIALEKVYGKDSSEVEKFKSILTGENIFIFTKENPFKVYLMLERSRVNVVPSPGDIASEDIVIPEGSTGLPPGPAISEFSQAGVETRIVSGSIYVTRDTVVARKGEPITREVAALLSTLGIKPITMGLDPKGALSEGIFIPEEVLKINLEKCRKDVQEAYRSAYNLAVNLAYPVEEVISFVLMKAHLEAIATAIAASVFIPEVLPLLIARAEVVAHRIYEVWERPSTEETEVQKPREERKIEEEEERGEEEISSGLAALFG